MQSLPTAWSTISEDEYAKAMSLHGRPSAKFRAAVLLAASALFLATTVGSGGTRLLAVCILVGGAAGHFFMAKVLVPWRARRSYRKYPFLRRLLTVEAESAGVRFKSEAGEMRRPWADIHKWREDPEFVLMYLSPHLFHVVPKRLADVGLDIAGLTSALEKNVGKAT